MLKLERKSSALVKKFWSSFSLYRNNSVVVRYIFFNHENSFFSPKAFNFCKTSFNFKVIDILSNWK